MSSPNTSGLRCASVSPRRVDSSTTRARPCPGRSSLAAEIDVCLDAGDTSDQVHVLPAQGERLANLTLRVGHKEHNRWCMGNSARATSSSSFSSTPVQETGFATRRLVYFRRPDTASPEPTAADRRTKRLLVRWSVRWSTQPFSPEPTSCARVCSLRCRGSIHLTDQRWASSP